MNSAKIKKYAISFLVAALISIAYILKLARILKWPSTSDFGVIRSIIYIAMFSVWGIYIYMRIVQKQVRRYLSGIAALTVFWLIIRAIKYELGFNPGISRYLWYLYYLPIIFIPLLMLLVSLSLGKSEDYRQPKGIKLLFIPAFILLLLVLTNDFHQMVFSFPEDALIYSDYAYQHKFIYYIILAWSIECALVALVNIVFNCRIPGSKKLINLPLIPSSILVIYGGLYIGNISFITVYFNDLTIVGCLLIAASLESLLQCGLIQSNTHYSELFKVANIRAKIFDDKYSLILSSTDTKPFSTEILQQAEISPLLLDNGIRLSGAPVKGGHVIWSEDVSELTDILDELATVRNDLKEETSLLRENYNTERRIRHLEEQNRLYDEIHLQTAPQITLLDNLLKRFNDESDSIKKLHLLQRMTVVGVYLKRRSNLVFIGEQSPFLDERELILCFEETMNILELSGIECGCYINLEGSVSLANATAVFDFYEKVVEAVYDSLRSLLIRIYKNTGETVISIDVISNEDLSFLETSSVSLSYDEDNQCNITFRIPNGGAQ